MLCTHGEESCFSRSEEYAEDYELLPVLDVAHALDMQECE
jgi:hypothetical protein